MSVRYAWLLVLVPLVIAFRGSAEDKSPRSVADFKLVDPRTTKTVSLGDFADRKAVVVVFMSTVCPVNNAYMNRLNEFQKLYAPQGVQIVGINANHADSTEDIIEHARTHELTFPVLRDEGQIVADTLGAKRNPEAFVLDAKRVVRYRGRIDDQFTIDAKKLKQATRDLADAIESVVAGKEVALKETPASGCLISRAPKPQMNTDVTWSKNIATIMQKNCQECHRAGQIGPMQLLTYDDVSGWSAMIREVVSDKRMPPWYADPRFGHFSNDRSLKKDDIDTLIKWIDAGCPKGDLKDEPKPLVFPDTWRIGKPDMIISMDEEFDVPAEAPKGGIPYQLFVIDPGFKEDMWVQSSESRAGAPDVVHHVLAYIAPPRDRIDPTMPDFPFLPGVKNARVLSGTAPGDMPMMYPEGAAIRIPAGSSIVFQMHYTPNGKAAKDRSSIGLIFAKKKPERAVITVPIFNHRLQLPPGADNHQIESWFTFKHDAKIYNFMPHMHLRGKDFQVNLVDLAGKESTQLLIPRYNFNWQNVYRYQEPIPVPKGTKVHCIAHYDNSSKNPLNPDPTKRVGWGDQTWQEMMIGWMDMVYDIPPE